MSLPAVPMCECCPEPGRCCKRLHLDGPRDLYFWKSIGTPLHALAKMAEYWLPFLPVEALEYVPDGGGDARSYIYRCPELRADGRCSIYENRPQLCRDFKPGSNPLCVYHVGERPK